MVGARDIARVLGLDEAEITKVAASDATQGPSIEYQPHYQGWIAARAAYLATKGNSSNIRKHVVSNCQQQRAPKDQDFFCFPSNEAPANNLVTTFFFPQTELAA